MLDSSITNSRSVGSGGRLACLQRLVALANVSGFGSVGKAAVDPISSNKTSSTIADAGRNKSSVAFRLMAAVNFAVSVRSNFTRVVVDDSNFKVLWTALDD